jgi:vacuolar-type H+-ATPase subunit I/STV1
MSKKDEAFRLFDEGKKPSDPEVKALGLSAKTRYNYYQEHKKSLGGDGSGVSEIQELKQEKTRLTLLSQIEELEAKREQLPQRVGKLERQVTQIAKWLDENKFENHELILFIINTLVAVETGKTFDKDFVEGMMEDAEKDAITSERENGKYVDKIEGV